MARKRVDDDGEFKWKLEKSTRQWEPFRARNNRTYQLDEYIEKNYLDLHNFAVNCGVSEDQIHKWIYQGVIVYQHRMYMPMDISTDDRF